MSHDGHYQFYEVAFQRRNMNISRISSMLFTPNFSFVVYTFCDY